MKRNFWPYAIVAYFVVFITGIVTWVVFAVHHEDQLVRPDYYEHEIRFQQQIDRVARTSALTSPVQILYHQKEQTISLALPANHTADSSQGVIRLYRPSDARLDREVKLALDEHGSQTVDVSNLPSGLWKVHLSWTTEGSEYYFDQPLVVARK